MTLKINKYKYLVARRSIQITVLGLFLAGNYLGWEVLRGNYSSARLFGTVPLSDPYAILQILASGFIASTDVLLGGIIILVIYGLVNGRMFCSWICLFNIVADTAIWSNKRLGITTQLRLSRKIRYGILVLSLILSAIIGISAFEAISPVSILHRGLIFGFGAGWAVILAIFLFDVAVVKYGWCGHLCPLGAFYSFIGRFSVLKVKHSKEKCTDCLKCFDVCHEVQVLDIIGKKTGIIQSSECTNCARCIEACDDEALFFTLRSPLKQTTKKKQLS